MQAWAVIPHLRREAGFPPSGPAPVLSHPHTGGEHAKLTVQVTRKRGDKVSRTIQVVRMAGVQVLPPGWTPRSTLPFLVYFLLLISFLHPWVTSGCLAAPRKSHCSGFASPQRPHSGKAASSSTPGNCNSAVGSETTSSTSMVVGERSRRRGRRDVP